MDYEEEEYQYQSTLDDSDLKKVGMELMFLTPEKTSHDEGVSAVVQNAQNAHRNC